MIRMLSGLAAPVIGGLVGLFRKDEKLSAYRIVLATTTTVGWGLWAGWVQWVILGQGVAGGGFAVCFATFLARWAMLSWVCGVLLASLCDDLDEIMSIVPVMLMLCAFGTLAQGMYTHDVFTTSPRTHYRTVVSCEHCGQSCYVNVKTLEASGAGFEWLDERVRDRTFSGRFRVLWVSAGTQRELTVRARTVQGENGYLHVRFPVEGDIWLIDRGPFPVDSRRDDNLRGVFG